MVATGTTLRFDTPRPSRRTPRADDPDAFDLSRPDQYETVRKLYFGRFSARVRATGTDVEDGFSEVIEGLLRKSRSERSRWDPTRGSLSTWLYVAMSGLCANLAEKAARKAHTSVGRGADVSAWTWLQAPEPEPEVPEPLPGSVLDLFGG